MGVVADDQLSSSTATGTSILTDASLHVQQIPEAVPAVAVGRHYSASDSDNTGGPVVSGPSLQDTVTIHVRSSPFDSVCLHRVTVPLGSYCRPNCDKCPRWGARECLFSRRQVSLAYCDLCPHYGKPGCIFASSNAHNYTALPGATNSPQCRSTAFFSFLIVMIYLSYCNVHIV